MCSSPVGLRSADVPGAGAALDRVRRIRIARVDVHHSLTDARSSWERLTAADCVYTPFSRFQWIAAWQRHVGEIQGATPVIIVARDDDDVPLFLLPLARTRCARLNVARYFGERHAYLNMGLWRRDAADAVTPDALRAVFQQVAAESGIDLFVLRNQPAVWAGCANPLARLSHRRAVENVHRLDFCGFSGEQVIKERLGSQLRKNLNKKERKLQALDGYRYLRAGTIADVNRFLDAFVAQKAANFAARGVSNAFGEPGIMAFLHAACQDGLAEGRPVIELHAIEGDGEVLAVIGGSTDGRRFAAMFNSYTQTEHSRWSPGLILVTHVVRTAANRGLDSFDLGAGQAAYKSFFCKDVDHLFDNVLPFSAPGHAAAAVCRAESTVKRWIKQTPAAWNAVQALRRKLS
jgi:CelD/BcsL family acetyltransferase involved in cellulose biosynthesis